MKKVLSLLVALIMVFGMASAVSAAPFYLESAGVTIEVPEGLTGEDATTDEYYALKVSVDANPNLVYVYVLGYDENLEGRWMEDLSDEEGEALLAGIAQSLANPSFGGTTVNDVNVLIAADETGTQLHYVSLLNGWVCDVAAVKTDGEALTDEEIQVAADMLVSIQFDEAEADAEEAEVVEGEETEEAAE